MSLLFKFAENRYFVIIVGLYLFIAATLLCITLYLTSVHHSLSNTRLQTLFLSRSHSNSRIIISEDANVEDKITNLSWQNRLPVFKFKASFIAKPRDLFFGAAYMGRLGNQLFQFASGYGIARLLNRTFVMGTTDEILQLFTITDIVLTDRVNQIMKWPYVYENQCCAFDKTVVQRAERITGNTWVANFLQSWKYFAHVVNEIRMQLRFQSHIQEKANDIMREIFLKYSCSSCIFRNVSSVFVGVHIRRGDIMEERYQRFGYLMAPIEYIDRAMNYYIQHFKNIIFIVCSDDKVWTKTVLKNSSNMNIELVHGPSEVDLAVLASCNHSVITVETFGWWAGFLAGGQVIYYKYQAREGTILREEFSESMDDYFLPHWIPMS